MHIKYVDNFADLEQACQLLGQSSTLFVDTEFHRETTYYPKLALIQLATTEHTFCVDPLTIQNLQPLQILFANANILKVFHAAWQDMEIFLHTFGTLPAPVPQFWPPLPAVSAWTQALRPRPQDPAPRVW